MLTDKSEKIPDLLLFMYVVKMVFVNAKLTDCKGKLLHWLPSENLPFASFCVLYVGSMSNGNFRVTVS